MQNETSEFRPGERVEYIDTAARFGSGRGTIVRKVDGRESWLVRDDDPARFDRVIDGQKVYQHRSHELRRLSQPSPAEPKVGELYEGIVAPGVNAAGQTFRGKFRRFDNIHGKREAVLHSDDGAAWVLPESLRLVPPATTEFYGEQPDPLPETLPDGTEWPNGCTRCGQQYTVGEDYAGQRICNDCSGDEANEDHCGHRREPLDARIAASRLSEPSRPERQGSAHPASFPEGAHQDADELCCTF